MSLVMLMMLVLLVLLMLLMMLVLPAACSSLWAPAFLEAW